MEQYRKNPGTAAVLSFIFNGLGQLYNGQIIKGLVLIFFSAVSILVFIIGSVFIGFCLFGKVIFVSELWLGLILTILSLFSICIIGIYSIVDAYKSASNK